MQSRSPRFTSFQFYIFIVPRMQKSEISTQTKRNYLSLHRNCFGCLVVDLELFVCAHFSRFREIMSHDSVFLFSAHSMFGHRDLAISQRLSCTLIARDFKDVTLLSKYKKRRQKAHKRKICCWAEQNNNNSNRAKRVSEDMEERSKK